MVFTIHVYGHGGYLGHVTEISRFNIDFPDPGLLNLQFGFNWQSNFQTKRFTNNDGHHVYSTRPAGSNHLES